MPPTGFEPMRLTILALLIRRVNDLTTPPLIIINIVRRSALLERTQTTIPSRVKQIEKLD